MICIFTTYDMYFSHFPHLEEVDEINDEASNVPETHPRQKRVGNLEVAMHRDPGGENLQDIPGI
jgi:hypothetical protein